MTLTDTGPLVAVLDKGDSGHARCTVTLSNLSKPLVTTWPCFTEAMHLLGRSGGWTFQDKLWQMHDNGLVQFYELSDADRAEMRRLMTKYADTPMDLADASLVVAAESLHVRKIFTTDTDFGVYPAVNRDSFAVVP